MSTTPRPYRLADGVGERHLEVDRTHGFIEVLELGPDLSGVPEVEKLVHARATEMNALTGVVLRVLAVKRQGSQVFLTMQYPRGLRLSSLLAFMAANPGRVQPATVLAIGGAIMRSLAIVHKQPDGLVHGAISPDHVVLPPEGKAVLSDGMLGTTLPRLEFSRERLWRGFSLVMPSAATLPRFDQRADVTQAAGVILALAIGRRITHTDFPRAVPELLASVMAPAEPAMLEQASQFRAWLQRALQLPTRGVFNSATDAEQALVRLSGKSIPANSSTIRTLVRELMIADAGDGQPAAGLGGKYSRTA